MGGNDDGATAERARTPVVLLTLHGLGEGPERCGRARTVAPKVADKVVTAADETFGERFALARRGGWPKNAGRVGCGPVAEQDRGAPGDEEHDGARGPREPR